MRVRKAEFPPLSVYPLEPWRFVERGYHPENLAQDETLFALSNGYIGMRGALDESRPTLIRGTLVNGFHDTWPIVHGETAFGFATTGQTIVNVPDLHTVRLYVDEEPLFLPSADLEELERALDMRRGTLDRSLVWRTPSGKRVQVRSRRLASLEHRHLIAVSYDVRLLDGDASIDLVSMVIDHPPGAGETKDPRKAKSFADRPLELQVEKVEGSRILLGYQARHSGMSLGCGVSHHLDCDCDFVVKSEFNDHEGRVHYAVQGQTSRPIRLVKYGALHSSQSVPAEELVHRASQTLDRGEKTGFVHLLAEQERHTSAFWRRSDVELVGDFAPRAQQCIRWNLFQLMQASERVTGAGIAARALTGTSYDGHYFWDTEIYILPFLIYTAPHLARDILRFRYQQLDKARARAREVNHRGAKFAWRTISGDEASAYYAAGTAQYHINADIMYALRKYVFVTGDEKFLLDYGAEMLVETARLWVDLGHYSPRKGGKFCIHSVTGPDEYNAVVDNNAFTNLMARENLRYAVATVDWMYSKHRLAFHELRRKTGLKRDEFESWKRAAEAMYVPFDEELGVHLQDEAFLDKKDWDFENTPENKYPLLLNYHPLVIYRHKVIKQADLVLAMLLLDREFSQAQKRANFDYYDPLTTGDSSLSASIQSIMAAELGNHDKALEYFRAALLMDIANVSGSVADGVHIASAGGTWMALVYGFAGLRDSGGELRFWPSVPKVEGYMRFRLTFRGHGLEVTVDPQRTRYVLEGGPPLAIQHCDEPLQLEVGKPVDKENVPRL